MPLNMRSYTRYIMDAFSHICPLDNKINTILVHKACFTQYSFTMSTKIFYFTYVRDYCFCNVEDSIVSDTRWVSEFVRMSIIYRV